MYTCNGAWGLAHRLMPSPIVAWRIDATAGQLNWPTHLDWKNSRFSLIFAERLLRDGCSLFVDLENEVRKKLMYYAGKVIAVSTTPSTKRVSLPLVYRYQVNPQP